MNATSMINLVKKFTKQYGVEITWTESAVQEYNSRGVPVLGMPEVEKKATVLLLKEKFTVMSDFESVIGLAHDHARYLLLLPKIEIEKDTVITDTHGKRWKTGSPDWFDIQGKPIARQIALTEVE